MYLLCQYALGFEELRRRRTFFDMQHPCNFFVRMPLNGKQIEHRAIARRQLGNEMQQHILRKIVHFFDHGLVFQVGCFFYRNAALHHFGLPHPIEGDIDKQSAQPGAQRALTAPLELIDLESKKAMIRQNKSL